jgi:hypothetical protein
MEQQSRSRLGFKNTLFIVEHYRFRRMNESSPRLLWGSIRRADPIKMET